MAKEQLYKEIVGNKKFEWKDKNNKITTEKISKWNEVLMEMPYCDYGDGRYTPYDIDYSYNGWICAAGGMPREDMHCWMKVKNENGYCNCQQCEGFHLEKGMKIFDIAIVVLDGNGIYWIESVIEIVNKHYPKWKNDILEKIGHVYIIKAEDVLKRVSNTPVFVENHFCMWERDVERQTNIRDKEHKETYPNGFNLIDVS